MRRVTVGIQRGADRPDVGGGRAPDRGHRHALLRQCIRRECERIRARPRAVLDTSLTGDPDVGRRAAPDHVQCAEVRCVHCPRCAVPTKDIPLEGDGPDHARAVTPDAFQRVIAGGKRRRAEAEGRTLSWTRLHLCVYVEPCVRGTVAQVRRKRGVVQVGRRRGLGISLCVRTRDAECAERREHRKTDDGHARALHFAPPVERSAIPSPTIHMSSGPLPHTP